MTMSNVPQDESRSAFAQELFNAANPDAAPPQAAAPRVRTGANFHAYCPNQAALAQALWRTALEEFDHQANELSRQEVDPIEGIKALATAYAQFAVEKPARFEDMFQLDNGRLATERNANPSRENAYRALLQLVTEAMDLGLLRPNDPELVAQTLWAGIHGVVSLAKSWNDFPFKPQEMLFSSMSETLMVGVLADRPQE